MNLFDTYLTAYRDIRRRYNWPDEPVIHNQKHICEPLPPKGWSAETYSAYFGEVMRLVGWYQAAWKYAAKRRKTPADRDAYLKACDDFAVAGKDLRFEGESSPALF